MKLQPHTGTSSYKESNKILPEKQHLKS